MNLKQRLQESTDPRAVELLREFEALEVLQRFLEREAERVLSHITDEQIIALGYDPKVWRECSNLVATEMNRRIREQEEKELAEFWANPPKWFEPENPQVGEYIEVTNSLLSPEAIAALEKRWFKELPGLNESEHQVKLEIPQSESCSKIKPVFISLPVPGICAKCGNETNSQVFSRQGGPLCDTCFLGKKACEFY